jgi:hypothetical protein
MLFIPMRHFCMRDNSHRWWLHFIIWADAIRLLRPETPFALTSTKPHQRAGTSMALDFLETPPLTPVNNGAIAPLSLYLAPVASKIPPSHVLS